MMNAEFLLDKFAAIRLLIFDMDGVLTDGSLLLVEGGSWVRTMNIKDGFALQLAVQSGFHVAVVSGSGSKEVADRLLALGVDCFKQFVSSKSTEVKQLMASFSVDRNQTLFMGDDLPDLEAFDQVGLTACPADAVQEIPPQSDYISPISGGRGCVRDVVEKTMRAQHQWPNRTGLQSI